MRKSKFLLVFILSMLFCFNVNAQSIFVTGDNLNDTNDREMISFAIQVASNSLLLIKLNEETNLVIRSLQTYF